MPMTHGGRASEYPGSGRVGRKLARAFLLSALCVSCAVRAQTSTLPQYEVYEATIQDLQAAMTSRRVTALQLVDAYLARIAAYDQSGPRLNAMIRLNPAARAEAAARDAERRAGHTRGPMHGIPVILKDNYATSDMATSAGSIAFAGLFVPYDAFQVKKLREAGAVILGKANMDELAETTEGVSSLGGQTRNPYDPARSPGGSSAGSGAATAASFAAVAFGTDTCGSMRIPAADNALFTLRPTKGLSSVAGIVPSSHTHDTAGPLARTVTDLAISLDATVGEDAADPATGILAGHQVPQFVSSLDAHALRGSRFGILTAFFGDEHESEAARVVRHAVDLLKEQGATVIDVKLPSTLVLADAAVWNYEFKFDLIDYLAHVPTAPIHSLSEILEHKLYREALEVPFRRYESATERDTAQYRAALKLQQEIRAAVLEIFRENQLDAIVYPTLRGTSAILGDEQPESNAMLSAATGFPALVAPAGLTQDGIPVGMEFLGMPLEDAHLVAMAYAYEQAARPRQPPFSTPPVNGHGTRKPKSFGVIVRAADNVSARAIFSYDPLRSVLAYRLSVSASDRNQIYAIALTDGTPDHPGPIMRQLLGPGMLATDDTITLHASERSELLTGRIYVSLYTREDSTGSARVALIMPTSTR